MVQKESQLSRLSNARRWLELFEADYPDAEEDPQSNIDQTATEILANLTKTYITELMHSTGLAVEYKNVFERYQQLNRAAGSIDEVIRHTIGAQCSNEKLPSETSALIRWVFSVGMDVAFRINAFDSRSLGLLPSIFNKKVCNEDKRFS